MTAKANDILNALISDLTTAGFKLVTRRKLEILEIAKSEFNAVIIEEGNDSVDSMGVNGQVTKARWQLSLKLYVISTLTLSAKDAWYEQAALIGRTIAADRQLSGCADSAAIVGKVLDSSVYEPFASGTLDLTIKYRFNDLTQGG